MVAVEYYVSTACVIVALAFSGVGLAGEIASPSARAHDQAFPELQERAFSAVVLHRYEDALRDFDELLVMRPKDVEMLWNRADVLEALGRLPEAEAGARQALQIAPGDPEVQRVLGWILARQNKVFEGLRLLRSSHVALMKRGGKKALSHTAYGLASVLLKTGDAKGARHVLDETYSRCEDCRSELGDIEAQVSARLKKSGALKVR